LHAPDCLTAALAHIADKRMIAQFSIACSALSKRLYHSSGIFQSTNMPLMRNSSPQGERQARIVHIAIQFFYNQNKYMRLTGKPISPALANGLERLKKTDEREFEPLARRKN
jgi:hypothetical protein